jgi:hypothetical protein
MKLLVIISLFLLYSRASVAENIVVYFGGGGGATNKDTTIFDQSIADVAAFASTNGYQWRRRF